MENTTETKAFLKSLGLSKTKVDLLNRIADRNSPSSAVVVEGEYTYVFDGYICIRIHTTETIPGLREAKEASSALRAKLPSHFDASSFCCKGYNSDLYLEFVLAISAEEGEADRAGKTAAFKTISFRCATDPAHDSLENYAKVNKKFYNECLKLMPNAGFYPTCKMLDGSPLVVYQVAPVYVKDMDDMNPVMDAIIMPIRHW